jgi:hypothetical protein
MLVIEFKNRVFTITCITMNMFGPSIIYVHKWWQTIKKTGYLFNAIMESFSGHGIRAVWGMNILQSLGARDCEFESRPGHGCLTYILLCLCYPVWVESLRRAEHLSKESYRLWKIKKPSNQPYAPMWERVHKYGDKTIKKWNVSHTVNKEVKLSNITDT